MRVVFVPCGEYHVRSKSKQSFRTKTKSRFETPASHVPVTFQTKIKVGNGKIEQNNGRACTLYLCTFVRRLQNNNVKLMTKFYELKFKTVNDGD